MEEGAVEPRAGHRADIQGLRAIAVLLVVACHSGIGPRGGFIGVDVFFVVSGFVIGAALVRELQPAGRIGLGAFYARRARRILPSLTVLVVAALAVGVLVLDPVDSQPIAFRTALASSLFVGNAYLYRNLGYFDASADAANPFLHLWSLSVEEQFYLVLPGLLWLGWRLGKRTGALAVLGAGALVSFVVAWALVSGRTDVVEAPERLAFFSSATRFWELAVGVLLALVPTARRVVRRPTGAVLAALGLVLIAVAGVVTDPLGPFPGPAVLPAIVGTALVLAVGEGTRVGRALGVAPLRWIGDRSYTWYLWHWPAIVYARVLWPGSGLAPVVAAVGALGVAALVYARFEDPIRHRPSLVGWRAVRLAALCVAVGVGASLVAIRGASAGWGVDRPGDWGAQSAARGNGCLLYNRDLANVLPASCTVEPSGPASGRVLVVGDEHAASVSTTVLEALGPQGAIVTTWARAGCPMSAVTPARYDRCEEWQAEVLDLVEEVRPQLVVLANRSTAYTTDVAPPPAVVGAIELPTEPAPSDEEGAVELWGEGLRTIVARIRETGAAVVVVGGPPTYRDRFPTASVLHPDPQPPARPRAEVDAEHDPVVAAEREALDGLDGVAYVAPVPELCGEDLCRASVAGRWTHLNAFDLNDHGARLLEPALQAAVSEALAGR